MAEKKRGPGRPPGSKNNKTKGGANTVANRSKKSARSKQTESTIDNRLKDEIAAIIMIAIGVFLAVALQTKLAGALGVIVGLFFKGMFGFGAFFLPYIMIVYGALMFAKVAARFRMRTVFLIIVLFLMADLVNAGRFVSHMKYGILGIGEVYSQGGQLIDGGVFGMYAGSGLYKLIGLPGLYIFSVVVGLLCLLLLINTPIAKFFEKAKERREKRKNRKETAKSMAEEKAKAKALEEEELAKKREAVENAGRQVEMDYKPPSHRAEFLAQISTPKKEKDLMASTDIQGKAGKKTRSEKLNSKDWKKLPSNQKNILDLMQDESIFEERDEKNKGYGLDGTEIIPRIEQDKNLTSQENNINNGEEEFDGFVKREAGTEPKYGFTTDKGTGEIFEKPEDLTQEVANITQGKPDHNVVIGGESVATASSLTEKVSSDVTVSPAKKNKYKLPVIELLNKPKETLNNTESKESLWEKATLLEATLQSFNVDAKVVNVISGPSVTRYEIEPARGVKVQSITRLADDLALNMRARSIRIEAPIPGKAAVGIEIENEHRQMVALSEIIKSKEFREHKSKLAFTVGRDIGGKAVVADLGKMPHMLIAGATGAGKSVCINTIIMSILYKARPEEVKLVLIDPKMVELGNYNGIPHLLVPVVTDSTKAAAALQWAVAEMTDRYKKFASQGVRDIGSYNSLMKNKGEIDEILPQIVIIIDELADLMMVASSQVEDAICRLAQLARAAGMHLILATQRPSVDVITGLIKANVPSRIAFMVSSQIDSRTVIDMAGAEKLVGNGDMLFKPQDLNKPKRIQGPFVSDGEVERVIDFVKSQIDTPEYNETIIDKIERSNGASISDSSDELLDDAIEMVIGAGQGSVSMLQRRFRIGYNRAARIIDIMEEIGVIGAADGSRPRPVIMTMEQWRDNKE